MSLSIPDVTVNPAQAVKLDGQGELSRLVLVAESGAAELRLCECFKGSETDRYRCVWQHHYLFGLHVDIPARSRAPCWRVGVLVE
jgi:hypothetical protein